MSGMAQSKGVHITLRMRLECTILRRDARDTPEPAIEVLNEVVVDRGSGPYLTKIECWERDHLITKVRETQPVPLSPACHKIIHLSFKGIIVLAKAFSACYQQPAANAWPYGSHEAAKTPVHTVCSVKVSLCDEAAM